MFGYCCVPYTAHGLLMRLEHSHVVHVGLPILNVATMIAGNHPVVVV